MSSSKPFLSVIIPAYNEAGRIGQTLENAGEYLRHQPYPWEIVVVDDGSTDGTDPLVRGYASQIRNLKLLQFRRNEGKGWAVRAGMLESRGRYRLFMDADGSTDICYWEKMLDALLDGAHVVVSSRHLPDSYIAVRQSSHRELLGGVFRSLVRIVSGLELTDTQNGFKAFTAEAAERIFRHQRVQGWAFDVEILTIAKRLNYATVEVPITWIDDSRSRMKFLAMPRMLLDLGAIRMRDVPEPRRSYTFGNVPQLITLS